MIWVTLLHSHSDECDEACRTLAMGLALMGAQLYWISRQLLVPNNTNTNSSYQ
jgi:hypothetical protein